MSELRYYKAAGRSLGIVDAFQAERVTALENARALRDELGAVGFIRQGDRIQAFEFKDTPTKKLGLRATKVPVHGHGDMKVWVPHVRSTIGRALAKRIASIRFPGSARFTTMLFADEGESDRGLGGGWLGGRAERGGIFVHYCTLEDIGGVWVIGVPSIAKKAPPDAEPLSMSAYWALRESRVAAEEEASP